MNMSKKWKSTHFSVEFFASRRLIRFFAAAASFSSTSQSSQRRSGIANSNGNSRWWQIPAFVLLRLIEYLAIAGKIQETSAKVFVQPNLNMSVSVCVFIFDWISSCTRIPNVFGIRRWLQFNFVAIKELCICQQSVVYVLCWWRDELS